MTAHVGGSAIFVLPTTTAGQLGPVAGWISTSGWAAAAERVLGEAWIVTRHGVLDVDEVRHRAATTTAAATSADRRVRRTIPPVAKTLVKDAREALRARQFHIDPAGPWVRSGRPVEFVWQRHEMFHTAGLDLARDLGVPSVLFVPALLVWQAEQWAVTRPGWGRWLERRAELPALSAATVVACGTDVVAAEVARLGIPDERVMVTPSGVDLELFADTPEPEAARRALGLEDTFVIGWAGSFRAFHALDDLVHAASAVDGATLLLVGDGPERPGIERLAAELGVRARFTGMVPHAELPDVLAAMHVGVVLGRPGEPFHYSPLKVTEYLAAGVPVVAPTVPELMARLDVDVDAVFFQAGDRAGLAAVLAALAGDRTRRDRLAAAARTSARAWSWDRQIERIREALSACAG